MKILYVITGLGQGGAERVVCDLADKMFEKGHSVKIAYLTGNVLTRPRHDEIELIQINMKSTLSLPKAFFTLSKVIKSYNPNVVHTHMVHANLLTRLVRLVVPMNKLISTAHNSNEGGSARMLTYRITHNLADVTTNVSETAVASFEKNHAVPKNSMRRVYNGVDFNGFTYDCFAKEKIKKELNLEKDKKIILAVGRFNEQKNYPNLLKAINRLKEQSTVDFILLVAGDGELRNDIEELIRELKLNNEVALLGRRNDISTLMSACDLFVLSSDYEGLPTVLIEALACQAHVVSTEVSGVFEIIGEHGCVVPVNDSHALSQAIEKILKNNNKNILGLECAKDKFDLDTVSDEWLEIYYET